MSLAQVCHADTIPEVKDAYVNFLTHCYIDTEVEMKEIYTSNHMWQLFEKSFLLDMGVVSNSTHDRDETNLDVKSVQVSSIGSSSIGFDCNLYELSLQETRRSRTGALRHGDAYGHHHHILQEPILGSEHDGSGKKRLWCLSPCYFIS